MISRVVDLVRSALEPECVRLEQVTEGDPADVSMVVLRVEMGDGLSRSKVFISIRLGDESER